MVVTADPLAALRDSLRGVMIERDDPRYEQARAVWNGIVDRRPAAVVRPSGTADVIATVRAARETGLPLAIRCGGHSIPGVSTCDDGIVLDLSSMRGVTVDPEARVAHVAGGALLGDVDHETMAFGLATPTGTVSHTGVAGLTLGGGLGRLMRKHGLTIDNLRAVDLVTADGALVRASDDENPDLFWAIRGAGTNFGVVTRFEFDLHPQNQISWAALAAYPIDRAADVLGFFAGWATDAPDELVPLASLQTIEAGGPFPPELIGQRAVVLAGSYCGDSEEAADRATAAMRSFDEPMHTMFVGAPYLFFQTMMDEGYAWGRHYYDKGFYLAEMTDAAIEQLLVSFDDAPHGASIGMITMGGALGRVPEDATAFTGRDAMAFLTIEMSWDDRALDDERIGWGRRVAGELVPHTGRGNYINAVESTSQDVVRAAYGDATYERLVQLKTEWDPDNLFRLNTNIRPKGWQPA